MSYNHGIKVVEEATAVTAPISGTSGLQVVVGTAPVNLIDNPQSAVNVPIICNSFAECAEKLGYSDDFENYSLCQSMDLSFRVFGIAPVIYINVLNPSTHKKSNAEAQYTVVKNQIIITTKGVLKSSLVVKKDQTTLVQNTDYIATFDSEGDLTVTLISGGAGEGATTLTVSCDSIAPEMVTKSDIIGGYDTVTGKESGIECIRQVYPRFSLTAGLLLAPGWSQKPEVAAALSAKCENLNGTFRAECVIDIDTTTTKKYDECGTGKDNIGVVSPHAIICWPKAKLGDKVYDLSAVYAAVTAYTDAANDDVPSITSNKAANVTGAVIADGTEITLDQTQAEFINGVGVVTLMNDSGWKLFGNNTAAYPSTTDPKDRWINCRRFFSWWANSFICTYKTRIDSQLDRRLIESICDSENARGNAYVSQGKCAGARIEFRKEDNSDADILAGKLVFRQYLAPYPPAEYIVNTLSYDVEALTTSLE